jgi:pimeloyl-ACP methyl ester carboxylesterase
MLGLSLGGLLAPRIQASGGDFNGLILMAGTPRLLTDIMIEQFHASISAALEVGASGPELDALIAQTAIMEAHFATIPGMTREEAQATPSIGATAYYWWDLINNPFADFLPYVDVPMLVMQGSRDFQVLADVDFAMIQQLLAGRANVAFRLYDDLNHLFMHTDATDFNQHGQSVMTPGNVDAQVLRDLADWILAH